jgi:hypothetical protein
MALQGITVHKSFPFNTCEYFQSGMWSAINMRMDEILAGNSFNAPGDYRIEISGWGADNSFFVERTDLLWTASGEKEVQLRRALPEGTMVFIRLLAPEPSNGSVPAACKVRDVLPMDSHGRCRMRLVQMHPRYRESLSVQHASNGSEDLRTVCDTKEGETGLQHEEILR